MKNSLKLYNSLSRQLEEFVYDFDSPVGVYACGPTVYHYVTIGNWRTYFLGDMVVRVLKKLGYRVNYVMNITDVGHLVSDGDEGEDKLEKGARREGQSAWKIAEYYTDDFLKGYEKLRLVKPGQFVKATEHIQDQINLISRIEERGFVYQIDDGIYFDVLKYESGGNTYGELSTLDQIIEGARVTRNDQKRDARDFALWKFSPEGVQRDMEWDSPWGKGFPGWHIECSAMSMKYLGEQFAVHLGGEDLRSTHHPNEIAQSEAATGCKPFVQYWLHGAFLQIDGGRMGKSLGNAYTIADVEDRGFDPLDLRYFYFTGHYRKPLNFSWETLQAAKNARRKLVEKVSLLKRVALDSDSLAWEPSDRFNVWQKRWEERILSDFDMPGALAVLWQMLADEHLTSMDTLLLLSDWDHILGLDFDNVPAKVVVISPDLQSMLAERESARVEKNWAKADDVRKKIEDMGYAILDTESGPELRKL